MGCMNDKTYDGPCKLCGYSDSTPCIPTYMEPKTFLAERYIVGKVISYNGEGAVYIGFDTATGIKVTIKEFMPDTLCTRKKGETEISVIPSYSALYKTYMSEFIDLNKTLMKLRGMSHIQTVLDVFCENNTAYVVFEYINGISLKTYLANSADEIAWEQAKELFSPFFTTLSLIHAAGIIHRSISPSTIFVTDKLELKLSGFAISAARTTGTEIPCEMFAGYAAPEQYTNEINGTWTDIYGVSAVLYRCLTGCTPTEAIARNGSTLMQPMLINRNIPENISAAIMEGLELSPENRIRTVTEFVDRIFTQPKPQEIAEKKRRLSRKEKKQRSERIKLIVVMIFVLLIIAGFAAAFIMSEKGYFNPKTPETSEPPAQTSEVSQPVQTTPTVTQTTPQTPSEPESVVTGDTIKMPDFRGSTYEYKVDQMKNVLTLVPEFVYTNEMPAGQIFEQSIEPGTIVNTGTNVNVTVSKGPSKVPLPDFRNTTVDKYKAELSKLNIKYSIETKRSNEAENGKIFKCSVDVGDLVDVEHNQEIIIYLAQNYEPTKEPTREESAEVTEENGIEGIPVATDSQTTEE